MAGIGRATLKTLRTLRSSWFLLLAVHPMCNMFCCLQKQNISLINIITYERSFFVACNSLCLDCCPAEQLSMNTVIKQAVSRVCRPGLASSNSLSVFFGCPFAAYCSTPKLISIEHCCSASVCTGSYHKQQLFFKYLLFLQNFILIH